MRDGGQLQHGGGRAGMIRRGQRSDGLQLGGRGRGVEIALEDEVGLGGDFDGVRAAFHQVDRLGQQPGQVKGVHRAAAVNTGGQQHGRITPKTTASGIFSPAATCSAQWRANSEWPSSITARRLASSATNGKSATLVLVRAIDGNQLAGGD